MLFYILTRVKCVKCGCKVDTIYDLSKYAFVIYTQYKIRQILFVFSYYYRLQIKFRGIFYIGGLNLLFVKFVYFSLLLFKNAQQNLHCCIFVTRLGKHKTGQDKVPRYCCFLHRQFDLLFIFKPPIVEVWANMIANQCDQCT